MTVRVYDIAHSRSGDKGNTSNVAVIAYDDSGWDKLRRHLTAERVMEAYAHLAKGPIRRYELPKLQGAQLRDRERARRRRHALAAARPARQDAEQHRARDRAAVGLIDEQNNEMFALREERT